MKNKILMDKYILLGDTRSEYPLKEYIHPSKFYFSSACPFNIEKFSLEFRNRHFKYRVLGFG